jgi:pyruvate,orthophosphate dikinase
VLVEKSLDGKKSETYGLFATLMNWCSKVTRLQVRANSDTPEQTETALAFGATGIGLTRTEHMFFEGNRIDAMREMILAENVADRKKALAKILPYQKGDFVGIFKALKGFPATIRFLDPPLHEFLPHEDKAQQELAAQNGRARRENQTARQGTPRVQPDARFPRLPPRHHPPRNFRDAGARHFEAAVEVQKSGIKVKPEVMIPLVGFKKELDLQVEVVHRVAKEVMAEKKTKIAYMVGTMIEVPRGALTADEIAETAEFFSFGTNDLTQTCLGMSRDDSGTFLPAYAELEITRTNPFAAIDQAGTGQLMKIAVEKGNKTRPGIKLGICGEHGGDPSSVKFCHKIGLTYVSCSPFRVPVARLAAAQAALEEEIAKKAKK